MRHLFTPVTKEERADRRLQYRVEQRERPLAEGAEGELGQPRRGHRQHHGVKFTAAGLAVLFPDQPVGPARDDGLDGGAQVEGAGGEPGRQGVSDGLQAAGKRNDGAHAGFAAGLLLLHEGDHAAEQRAVRALGLPQHGEGVLDGELFRVARIDAGDQRVHGVVDELLIKVGAHQLGKTEVGRADARALEQLGEDADLGVEGKQGRAEKGARAGRHRLEFAAPHDEALLTRGAGGEQGGLEPQFLHQRLELGCAVLE